MNLRRVLDYLSLIAFYINMEEFDSIYKRTEQLCQNAPDKLRILKNLKNCEKSIMDVLNSSKSYEELKKLYNFPAFFDRNNAILFAHEIKNESAFLMLILKDSKIDLQKIQYNIKPTAFTTTSTETSAHEDTPAAEDAGAEPRNEIISD